MESQLSRFQRSILNNFLIDLSVFERKHLLKCISKFLLDQDYNSIDIMIDKFLENNDIFIDFYSTLYNGYSSFFRDKITFSMLENSIIPRLLHQSDEKLIRIWSVGCSKGQEAYSLAIACEEVKRKLDLDFSYKIFASDMSSSALTNAMEGKYHRRDMDNVTLEILSRYFSTQNNMYYIEKKIKENITFFEYDIVSSKSRYPVESVFGDFDIVVCSNVLIYYSFAVQKDIIEKLEDSIRINGYLISDSSEKTLIESVSHMETELLQSSIYKK